MFDWNITNPNLAILILVVWEAFWKVIGLWKSAKRNEKLWFIAIFLINLLGLIPIFYLWRTKQLEEVVTDFRTFFRSRLKF